MIFFLAHTLYWLCLLLLAYVFVGYALGMRLWSRIMPQPVHTSPATPAVTVVMAVYEGAAHILAKLDNLAALDYPDDKIDVVVVCDGSGDATAALCRSFRRLPVQVVEKSARRGKAACLNDAVPLATGEVLLMTDVRQALEPMSLRRLTTNLADPAVGAVSGELRLRDPQTGFAKGVDAYWRYEKAIRHAESRSGSVVGVSGALYAMRRSLFEPLPEGTVLDDVLVPMRIAAAGHRVVFEPAAVAWDRPSQQPADERRRKVRTLAGNYQLVQLAPWLLLPWRNPLWWRFVSHKLLRLLAPWLWLLLALSSALLAARDRLCAVTLLALLAGGTLTLLGRLLPAVGRLMPVRLLLAFGYLNLFAAQGLVAFARNRRLHLW